MYNTDYIFKKNNLIVGMIYARDTNGLIGIHNRLPWPKIQTDMKHFNLVTKDNLIIMGRNTFESMPLLKGRTSLVVSKTLYHKAIHEPFIYNKIHYSIMYKSLYYNRNTMVYVIDKIESLEDIKLFFGKDIYFIGGTRIFSYGLKYCDVIYETIINHELTYDDVENRVFYNVNNDLKQQNLIKAFNLNIIKNFETCVINRYDRITDNVNEDKYIYESQKCLEIGL